MNDLHAWMRDWGVPAAALPDLLRRLGALDTPVSSGKGSESRQQSLIRLAAAREHETILYRNNKGVLPDQRGVPVRFGLANDNPAMSKHIRSADLIGPRKLLITPQHVGMHLGQFASYEVKWEGWHWTGTEHEWSQLRWALIIQAQGGDARFLTSPEQL